MAEPVTEEMLARVQRDAVDTIELPGADTRVAKDVLALVTEVRRLRAVTCPTCEQASDAAGYARAERDVVAWLRAAANTPYLDRGRFVQLERSALVRVADGIEDHCHRGASERAATGGEERR